MIEPLDVWRFHCGCVRFVRSRSFHVEFCRSLISRSPDQYVVLSLELQRVLWSSDETVVDQAEQFAEAVSMK